ncbi:MAG: glycosyltransferase family 4 protein [Wenzhouxiangellaceae bacterium]
MTRPLHIVQCLSALSYGGSELATVELAEGLLAAGHRLTLIAAGGALSPRCRAAGIELLEWPLGRKHPASLLWIRRLRRWLSENSVDVLHAQARLPAWLAWLAWRGMPAGQRPAWVTTIHGQYSPGAYSRIMASGERVIAVSTAMAQWARRLDPGCDERLRVVYGGVDPQSYYPGFRPTDDWLRCFDEQWPGLRQRPTISLVARGTRLKNHAGLIRLIAALRQRGMAVDGLVIGGFSRRRQHYLQELQGLASELGVAGQIHYLGDREDVRELMAVSSLVINISNKAEAFGRTLLEALALGRPVVSWDRGGASEILARLYPPGAVPADDEAALVERCLRILDDPLPVVADNPFILSRTYADTLACYAELVES